MAASGFTSMGNGKTMKKLTFVLIGTAALLTACNRGNQDQVNNAEMNQAGVEELNDLAANAAMEANEAAALGNQQAQLNEENAVDTTSPEDEQEQNVAGM
jgi:hypothetical protein